jgi:hypothetical protein
VSSTHDFLANRIIVSRQTYPISSGTRSDSKSEALSECQAAIQSEKVLIFLSQNTFSFDLKIRQSKMK